MSDVLSLQMFGPADAASGCLSWVSCRSVISCISIPSAVRPIETVAAA
jgi:hypothetical protein